MRFPGKFAWGAATASFQWEGGVKEEGRGSSIWDDFTRVPGKIYGAHHADVACDFYHRYPQDLALMKELGIPALRFSVSWSRILPEGTGKINEAGLDFYSRLLDTMLEKGIEPYMTLFHWDYPTALEYRGGWLNSESPMWYADYADIVMRRLGDRVKHVMTLNEPQCFIGSGYESGIDAPGLKRSRRELLTMAHHVMLAHGLGVQAIRAASPNMQVGYAPTCSSTIPATDSPEDIEAARRAYFHVDPAAPFWSVSWWSDPVMRGEYPAEAAEAMRADMPVIKPDDLKTMCQPLDFYAQNIYNGRPVKSDGRGGWVDLERTWGHARSACGWPITPEVLYWAPKFLYERYKLPFYITENGISCHDWVSLDGEVHDPNRIDMLERYIQAFGRAIADGVDGRGYFVWTLLDDFEWRTGYSDRFGLIYTDFQTLERIPKDSARWYGRVAQSNGGLIRG